MVVMTAAGLLSGLVLLAFWSILRKVVAPGQGTVDFPRIQGFSTLNYRPLGRLLSEADADFLKGQRGYEESIGKRLARQRMAIYKSYLGALCEDFEMLHKAARLMAATSALDQPELVKALFVQSLRFHSWMALVRLQLALNGAGLGHLKVNTESLVQCTGWMRTQLDSMVPAPAAIAMAR